MFIQTQDTPNPATIKFLPGLTVLENGAVEFSSADVCGNSPLAERLFAVEGVTNVFLGQDFVSISKADDTDWNVLKSMVMAVLMDHFSTGQPVVLDMEAVSSADAAGEDDDEITAQIRELIETRVRPSVMMDGGDIVFSRFEDGVVFLEMRGACSGCPSSTMTLKDGIENMLKHFVPEVTEVRPV